MKVLGCLNSFSRSRSIGSDLAARQIEKTKAFSMSCVKMIKNEIPLHLLDLPAPRGAGRSRKKKSAG